MKARPKKVVSLADTSIETDGWLGFLKRNLNTMSTVALLILAGVMLVRWRMRSAENARILVGNDLASAQAQVGSLRNGFLDKRPADQIKAINEAQTQASASIDNVINSSDATERMKADAYLLRGDMYWYLANLPPLPGSESEPSLRLSDSSDLLLQKSSDSYQQVVKDPALANEHEAIDSAHLGLAAIAENRGNWDEARKELQAVKEDPNAVKVLAEQAGDQLDSLSSLQHPLYVAPPNGVTSNQPTSGPVLPFGPELPNGFQLPSTMPSTMPASAAPSVPRSILTSPATTQPSGH